MKPLLQRLVLVCVWSPTGLEAAGTFRSYAEVLNVQPVVETHYTPVTREVCTEPEAAAREFTALAATIGEDIRHQQRLWQAQRSCSSITEQQPHERITAYRVTYRYRGHTSTTQLSYDPGERIPVTVSLSPLP